MKEIDTWNILEEQFANDEIRAVDAKYEAQKISFSPMTFQAAKALRDLGILNMLSDAGETGIALEDIKIKLNIEHYPLSVLLEIGLSMGIVKWEKDSSPRIYYLGKVGFFLQHDDMSQVNMDFTHDVCYRGAFSLVDSLNSGKPEGLKVFGDWDTIYQGLSSLPEAVQKSWFQFDHYYSDGAFSRAVEFVFKKSHSKLMDIGGNTAKWALTCTAYNQQVNVLIVDLPGQIKIAQNNINEAGLTSRISTYETDILDKDAVLPKGYDAIWMSQFLDCFSLDEITSIFQKIHNAVDRNTEIFVMEPLWDRQKYPAAVYSLHATSLYFTCMANGNSKMYGCDELRNAIERADFVLSSEIHQLEPNDYSILKFNKR